MSNPLIERMVTVIEDMLGDITVANGYNQTIGELYRPKTLDARGRTSPTSFMVQISLGDTQPNDEYDANGNPPVLGMTQVFQLDMVYRPSKAATDAIETVMTRFEADVRRTLMQDPQLNALACDADMDEPEWWVQPDDGNVGGTVMFNVHFRMAENDPYNVPGTPAAFPYIFDGGHADTLVYDDVIEGNGA